MDIKQIFNNNTDWIKEKTKSDTTFFDKLAKGQAPEILYIGCSDSRVVAEELMGLGPGEVFVHRNIANMVPSSDLSALSVVDYAVKHLKVKHAVVCGHYGCGGVKAAMSDTDLGILNPWLDGVKNVMRHHQTELNTIKDENSKYERLIELNAIEQCENLLKIPEVQKAVAAGNLKIHAWVFDLATGKLIDLGFGK